jgi:hypothetical protein
MEGQLQAPDSGSDVETQPGKKLTIQAIPRETVDLQLVHEQQPQVQPAWTESFNSEALRLLLATTFPNAQPSSWWLSGASTSSRPGQSFHISLTVGCNVEPAPGQLAIRISEVPWDQNRESSYP